MDIPVNYLAIVLAALSSMVIGTIWYAPKLCGGPFERLTGANPNKPRKPARTYILAFVASLLTAYVLAYSSYLAFARFDSAFILNALVTAFFLWLGFTAARVLVHEAFESRDLRIFFITSAYELVTVLVMALIIGAFAV